jgi:hypothetical protein
MKRLGRLGTISVMAVASLVVTSPMVAAAKPPGGAAHRFPAAVLIAAAKASPVKLVDNLAQWCDGDLTVEAWLFALTRRQASSIAWTARDCQLVNSLNPTDSGGGSTCVQAVIILQHPKNDADKPEIEIYLDDPRQGRPGPAFALRSMFDTVDGPDYERERRAFDDQWRERFPDTPARGCEDDG